MINIAIYSILFLLILGCIYYIYIPSTLVRVKRGQVFNFKQAVELAGLPIVTLYQDGKPYNFLFDTGSNVSHVHSGSDIVITDFQKNTDSVGGLTDSKECKVGTVVLHHGKNQFTNDFRYSDMSYVVQGVKDAYGVNMVGIIGTDFMDKYNYCLDFKDYVVYARK